MERPLIFLIAPECLPEFAGPACCYGDEPPPAEHYLFTGCSLMRGPQKDLAVELERRLLESGAEVLNRPSRVRDRFDLIEGIRLEQAPPKLLYPLIVRVEDVIGCTESPPAHDEPELREILAHMILRGFAPESMVISPDPGPLSPAILAQAREETGLDVALIQRTSTGRLWRADDSPAALSAFSAASRTVPGSGPPWAR